MMSNKLFLAGLATVSLVATSLVGVQSSQATPVAPVSTPVVNGVFVGGNTSANGAYLGCATCGAGSTQTQGNGLSVATGSNTNASNLSFSVATPTNAASLNVGAANAGPKTASGIGIAAVQVGPSTGAALAGAAAGNNGTGTSFGASNTNALSAPGLGAANAISSFGTLGF
jgi:hypothetical protein